MFEKVIYNGIILGIIIRSNFYNDGITFFTPEELSIQLAYMNHSAGKIIQPHIHNQIKREIVSTKEVLIIKRGKIRIDFYFDKEQYFESKILETGDIALLSEGGHGITMLDDTQFFEVKQGPYAGENDKVRFEGKESNFLEKGNK
jgi:hypothetical protein